MKPSWRRIAPLGLYLALVAALAAIGLYIVQREWNLPLQISLGLIVVGLALFAILDPEGVRVALTGRQARYGSNALVMSLAFIGILVVVNYLVFKYPQRWDLTENQQYTLAPETLDTLKSLPAQVKALAFYTPRVSKGSAEGLLDQYKFHSEGKFDYEFINPETDPIKAQQYNITRDGTVVVVLGEKHEPVTFITEKEVTGAMVRLMSTGKRAVYFLTGHGEFDPESTGEGSYSLAKASLENKNYTVAKLDLLSTNEIPQDAAVIIIAGPLKPITDQEVELLKAYMDGGGSLIAMEEPLPVTQFGDQPDPLADYLSGTWGIGLGSDMIVDQRTNQPYIAVGSVYGDSVITEKMQGVSTIYPTTRSVTAGESAGQIQRVELVSSSQQSWAESDLAALTDQTQGAEPPQIQPDEGVDLIGPVSLAMTAEDTNRGARLVVFGDSDFASDTFYNQLGNGDMFVNSVDWAAEQENLINLTPKDEVQRLLIPPGRYTMNLILLATVFILPGIVLLAGIIVWWQRRRRG
ncbi:MAG TPA: Gldg family protein [Anaerolineales bacterium]|nr:Gldg family protein [Anaerolineales bacterium]